MQREIGLAFFIAFVNATLNLDIIHKDDEPVVYLKNMKGGLGSSTDDLINVFEKNRKKNSIY